MSRLPVGLIYARDFPTAAPKRPAMSPIHFVAPTPEVANDANRPGSVPAENSSFVRERRGAECNRRWPVVSTWRADIGHIERELAQIQSARDCERAQGIELRTAKIFLRDQDLVEGGSLEDFLDRGNRSEHR